MKNMTIIERIKMEWLRLAGHVVRMDPSIHVKYLVLYNPDGKIRVEDQD